ncbi:right-handed parallel beta-helix repeat-containing protein [Pontibacter beigongshangensis]|uniref:right-handed parallel beta-helix repeat-containing protein n=1 Tax=Pontibacter beigongshangensis TaxID=2574733 RepID=UPI00164F5F4B|nr:right-handed parallel beta-helix repeat-containing protein [Pontibacter beigongshangensis]
MTQLLRCLLLNLLVPTLLGLSSPSAAAFSAESTFASHSSFGRQVADVGAPAVSPVAAAATNHYVAPTGNDANAGTLAAPYATVTKAISVAASGDTIFLRGGTYTHAATIGVSKSGSSNSRYYLFAYPGERAVLNFSAMSVSGSNRGMNLSGSYWHLRGVDFYKAGDNGMFVSGSNNIIEFCSFYENADTGLQLGGGASHNQVINCDSYNNTDPGHGNADGFAPKLDVGTGNYFYGCRAWQNSDDGWDGYMRGRNDVTTTLENCWVFKSGYLKDGSISKGNGNGFKMGGSDDRSLMHNFILKNCLAFDNRVKGFDQNNNKGSMTLYNCTAFNNGTNYGMQQAVGSGKTVIVKNSVSAGSGAVNIVSSATQQTNSWMSGFQVTSADFISINPEEAYGPRKPDGSLPDITFLHLAPGSDLIDRGTDVGLPFTGAGPDLGYKESGGVALSVKAESGKSHNLKIQGYPNPFQKSITFTFSLAQAGIASLTVYNATGQQVASVHNGFVKKGTENTIKFSAEALPEGIYYGVLKSSGQQAVFKMMLTK